MKIKMISSINLSKTLLRSRRLKNTSLNLLKLAYEDIKYEFLDLKNKHPRLYEIRSYYGPGAFFPGEILRKY